MCLGPSSFRPFHGVTVLFGGVEIEVPEDWMVHIDAPPVLGAGEDERLRRPAVAGVKAELDLIVTGLVSFSESSIN